MPYTKAIPQWNATGTQPPQSLIDNGWQFNQKPPADYFNWQWNSVYQVLNELHQFALHTEKLGVANGVATLGADSKLTAAQLPAIGSAQITDGSITNNDLATDVKVGSLATLTTTTKSNVVAAVNEVRSNLNTHTGDAAIHVTTADKTAWNAKAETTTATTSANGLMSSADKTKLDGVATGAQVNQNAFANVKVGTTTVAADSATDTLELIAGTNITLTPNATNDSVTIVNSTPNATTSVAGLMSSADKTKLDGVAANANNYVHPATHPATMIVEDADHRFVTDTEKATWNAKASTATATSSTNGLMSSADKAKLDTITGGANSYVHPTGDGNLHVPATGTTNNGKFLKAGATAGSISWETILAGDVSGLQALLDQKADTSHGHDLVTTTVAGFMAAADKVKLNGIASGANNYSHPTGDGNLHVPATSTTNNGKVLKAGSTAGSLSWGLIDWAEVTGKPSTYAPSAHSHAIADVTGLQTALDGKSDTGHTHAAATTSVNGFMASTDKSKLDGISANANRVTNPATNGVIAIDGVNTTVYAHPTGDGNSHVPATGTTNNRKALMAGTTANSASWQTILAGDVSGLQALLDEKSDTAHGHAAATTSVAGFMAAADKSKLDGIATGAQTNQNAFSNVKVGTTTVAADTATDTLELIAGTNISLSANATTDAVTITNSTPNATSSVTGLMSSTDKAKLDGIAAGANNYTHPATHPPSIIAQDASNRFTTDAEKAAWNAKASTAVATTSANGLMSSTDKTKLDGVATGANNYVHPSTHPATMITTDANNRFVTDTEKATWNAKASTAVATTSANGLMAAADKTKLDGIAADATKVETEPFNGNIKINGVSKTVYTHPASHLATMIEETASRVFVTPEQRADIDALTTDVYDAPVWATIPLQNSWVEFASYSTPQAFLSPNGFVYVRGWIRNGADGTVAGTLPAGYRPTKGHVFITAGTAGTKGVYRIQVGSDGTLTINQVSGTTSNSLITLDGIAFSTLS